LINLHTCVEELPGALVFKAGLGGDVPDVALDLWRGANWLKEHLVISSDASKQKVSVEAPSEAPEVAPEGPYGPAKVYRLQAVIVRVHDKRIKSATKDHFVACVDVPASYVASDASPRRKRKQGDPLRSSGLVGEEQETEPDSPTSFGQREGGWMAFNDFRVGPCLLSTVMDFTSRWKFPCVLVYADVSTYGLNQQLMPPPQLPPVLSDGFYCSNARSSDMLSFTPLGDDEVLLAGSLVAIDAEFVAIKGEEVEIRSDGSRAVTKAATLSLGRVSVVRGEGERAKEPFIDDYIATSEHVEDYLTQFSGLREGDLSVTASRHHLLPLKQVYKKLVYLVNLGVVFVGHNLKSDFRVINILVPPEQIRDTVDLFYIKGRRRIGLKFLCSYLLGTGARHGFQEGEHDSIEDAVVALQLYQMYEKVESQGPEAVREMLENVYLAGNMTQWGVRTQEEWAEINASIGENNRVLRERHMAAEAAQLATDMVEDEVDGAAEGDTEEGLENASIPAEAAAALQETVTMTSEASEADGESV